MLMEPFYRRAPAPKAWTSGTNPITQRGLTPVQQNGTPSQPKVPSNSKAVATKDQAISARHAHDRLTFVLGASFGSVITITTKTGDKFEGIMSGAPAQASDSRVVLKMAKRCLPLQAGQANGVAAGNSALTGTGPEHTMSFDNKDITEIFVAELTPAEPAKPPNGVFLTSVYISAINLAQVPDPGSRQIPTFHEIKFVANVNFNVGYPKQAKRLT